MGTPYSWLMDKNETHLKACATFETPHAYRYVQALCEHFSRRVMATLDGQSGHIAFPFGACVLATNATQLELVVTSSTPDGLIETIDIMTRHLERFAFRENPLLEWTQPDG